MHHNNLGQCHLTGLYQKNRTLWVKTVFSFLLHQTLLVSEVRRVSAKDGGESALSLCQESLATLSETINSDDCVLNHLHSMCQPKKHQGFSVFHKRQKTRSNEKLSKVSHSAQLVLSVVHLVDSISRVCTMYQPHKLLEVSLRNGKSVSESVFCRSVICRQ